jgi:hypothetical protein
MIWVGNCLLMIRTFLSLLDLPISAGSFFVIDDAGHHGKRRKKSFSDQEASSEESNGQSSSPYGNSQAIVTGSTTGTSNCDWLYNRHLMQSSSYPRIQVCKERVEEAEAHRS